MIIVLFPSSISRRFRKSSYNNIVECEKFWIAQNKQLTFHELVFSVIGVRRSKLSSTEHFFMVIFFNEQFAAIFNNFLKYFRAFVKILWIIFTLITPPPCRL